jgi:hypothetical protein
LQTTKKSLSTLNLGVMAAKAQPIWLWLKLSPFQRVFTELLLNGRIGDEAPVFYA